MEFSCTDIFSSGFESCLIDWFKQYAYDPKTVYLAVIGMSFASSLGLPFPEEIVIISTGLVAHIASRPDLYPPPAEHLSGVTIPTAAVVSFLAVFLSDFVIYGCGRLLGRGITERAFFKKLIPPHVWSRVLNWMASYGYYAAGVFRFTPGLRFPGHLACGMTKVPVSKFILVDGGAALLTVPTQIFLIGHYGQAILQNLRVVKMAALCLLLVVIVFFLARALYRRFVLSRDPGVKV